MSIFTYKQRNSINLVIIIALGCLIAYSLQGIFGAILSTLVLYTILRPVYLFMIVDKKLNRNISAILLLFGSLIVLVLPFYTLSSLVINKINDLQNDHLYFQHLLLKLRHLVPVGAEAQQFLTDGLRKAGTWATELFPSLISGAFNIVLGLLLMYFLLYFMLVKNERFEAALIKYAPFRAQNAHRFAQEMRNTTYANVLGQGFIALVQGSLVALSYRVLGYNDRYSGE